MKLFLLYFFIFCNGYLFADLGLPNMQAICRIKLLNGDEIEGYIFLAKGGYDRFYKQYGFALVDNDSIIHAYWFNLHLSSNIDIFKRKLDSSGQMFSLVAIRPWANIQKNNYHLTVDSLQLNVNLINTHEYLMKEKLEVYFELPTNLHLENASGKNVQQVLIDVNEIKELGLKRKPHEGFLEEIILRRKECWEEVLKNSNMQDYQEPLWYHEIYSDNNLREKMALHFLLLQF